MFVYDYYYLPYVDFCSIIRITNVCFSLFIYTVYGFAIKLHLHTSTLLHVIMCVLKGHVVNVLQYIVSIRYMITKSVSSLYHLR